MIFALNQPNGPNYDYKYNRTDHTDDHKLDLLQRFAPSPE